ncbi:ribonucleoside triphosphate reductase [Candidatus Falkowbacteria bacterium RIFOXYD2_FULL_35_9]|uniref:Ribonucleoside triphosphate reductase n=1 Tax=Candidatus Falkowbacteria bacterium RIFOXYC2_FULL_36_12 TaxID=1798002 RepID=A0A1F5SYR7_9BACT|nr:MAG: ribonucleoside triphosphate reductase [Candidatus Falkowbacteria bacterium RIFOXYB2_FULL_35_7]OGF31868.1 MAG: ribonucleoside triphosphate reductase [Candidatus Falkowbacteria bacterium RIFOXYC2_FULL_36_12]OGF45827.1 MAG: ribonucleoside triphosphate reductase [Candidatus Falkowbacteria bacterium RIFOXYD2_FULL_35_9]
MYAGNKIIQIRKRDGRIVDFEQEKITKAIFKALQATETGTQEDAENISDIVMKRINEKFHERTIPAVEEIQDMVENCLIEQKFIQAAKAYIIYRDQHAKIRDLDAMINSDQLMEDYLKLNDWRVKENSNMDYSLQGLNNYVASTVSSHYWLNKVYPPNIKDTHVSGDFHIHDLQLLAPYCCGWDFKDILLRGFGGVQGKVQSKPPKHFATALSQLVNFFYTLQGEAAGAQAVSSLDTLVAPFIRYDKLDFESVKQQVQMFLYNINVPTRVGFQTPFTNVTLDLFVPSILANESVIIGGQPQKEKYGEYQQEMDMFNKAFIEVMTEGDKSGRVLSWPIPTYNVTSTWDWDNPIIDQIMGMTAKYGIPYFSNFINSDMSPDDARSMCCRLRLDNRELRKRGGGLFGANPLTGSIGVVTINLPRIGFIAKDKEEYFARIAELMDLAKQSLEIKRKALEEFTKGGLYPYSKFYLSTIHERFGEYWKNHFNTIGLNGMNEASINLLGQDITTVEGHKFARQTLDFMRERLMDYQNETNQLFNLEATPAEGTSYRFAKIDKSKYPEIIVANEKDYVEKGADPYYTNSSQLPVGYTDDIFEALRLQDDLQTRYTGGTVLHGFVGEKMPSIGSTKSLVKKIAENFRLPYFTITPTFSICPVHGYISGEHEYCPRCDEEMGYIEAGSDVLAKASEN